MTNIVEYLLDIGQTIGLVIGVVGMLLLALIMALESEEEKERRIYVRSKRTKYKRKTNHRRNSM